MPAFVPRGLDLLATFFVGFVGLALLALAVMYVVDKTQTAHSVRRNFPVISRFRHLFEHLGEFFRQYFFAMDREELPFNRAQRTWAYRTPFETRSFFNISAMSYGALSKPDVRPCPVAPRVPVSG